MALAGVVGDWLSYLDTVDRALDHFDDVSSVIADEFRLPTEIFVEAPSSALPLSLGERARELRARIDRVAALVGREMSRVADRLGDDAARHREDPCAPAVYIDQKF